MISIFTHCSDADDQVNLLRKALSAILAPLSQKTKVGIDPPRKGHTRPLLSVVFLRPSKSNAALIRPFSIMVGCIEQPLKRLAGSFAGRINLIHSTAQCLIPLRGGYSLFKGVRTMSQNNFALHSEQNQTSESLLDQLQKNIDSTIAGLSAAQLPAKQAAFFAEEMQRAQVIHDTLKKNINDDDSLFIRTIINRVFEILTELRAEANTIKAETPEQLLTKLQQELDNTISALSEVQLPQFEHALDRIQKTLDHFNRPDADGCTQQVADILGFQLEEIREAAQKHRA